MRDIVSSAFAAIDFETPTKHWSFKFDQVDGRKKNGGRSKRQARSWHFKNNIILEHEKMQGLYPDTKEQASTLVAMVFNIDRNQVIDWRRSRDKTFQHVKGKCKNPPSLSAFRTSRRLPVWLPAAIGVGLAGPRSARRPIPELSASGAHGSET